MLFTITFHNFLFRFLIKRLYVSFSSGSRVQFHDRTIKLLMIFIVFNYENISLLGIIGIGTMSIYRFRNGYNPGVFKARVYRFLMGRRAPLSAASSLTIRRDKNVELRNIKIAILNFTLFPEKYSYSSKKKNRYK